MKNTKKTKRNSVLISTGLVVATALYVLSQYVVSAKSVASTIPSGQNQTISTVASSQTQSTPPAKKKAVSGLYANGTYTGNAANAYYGNVQVQAVIQNGALATVQIIQYPNTHSTSVYINNQALPVLQREAIQAQNANVNIVSGATFTSQAFQQSLSSALSQAQG